MIRIEEESGGITKRNNNQNDMNYLQIIFKMVNVNMCVKESRHDCSTGKSEVSKAKYWAKNWDLKICFLGPFKTQKI